MGVLAVRAMTPTSATRKNLRGFTLLELMIVLAILAMGSMLLIPNIGNMSGRTFNAQVREANALLNYTRRIAVVTGQPATASFFSASEDDDESETDTARSDLGRDESWRARGLVLSYRDSTDQTVEVEDSIAITFFPEGGSTGGALVLNLKDRQATISIDPFSGKVETQIADD